MGKFRLIFYIFLMGFILNLISENAQAPLCEGFDSFESHFMLCFWASIVDGIVIIFFYALIVAWAKDDFWIKKKSGICVCLSSCGCIYSRGF